MLTNQAQQPPSELTEDRRLPSKKHDEPEGVKITNRISHIENQRAGHAQLPFAVADCEPRPVHTKIRYDHCKGIPKIAISLQ
jgi:hypothetical protein